MVSDKSKTEVADLWYTYHESKVSELWRRWGDAEYPFQLNLLIYESNLTASFSLRLYTTTNDMHVFFWKENVHGLVLKGEDKSILDRAATR